MICHSFSCHYKARGGGNLKYAWCHPFYRFFFLRSSLSEDDHTAIERVQKAALRIILDSEYTDYSSALFLTNLETLRSRRKYLCLKFAQKCVKTGKLSDLFPINEKNINTRPHEKFYVTRAKTSRLAKSSVPYLQRLLNDN